MEMTPDGIFYCYESFQIIKQYLLICLQIITTILCIGFVI